MRVRRQTMLEELGYVSVGFTSTGAALAAFRADPQRFDVLITDERMPEMSGSALIREVRGVRGSLPVVLMSGYLGSTDVEADEVLVAEHAGVLVVEIVGDAAGVLAEAL